LLYVVYLRARKSTAKGGAASLISSGVIKENNVSARSIGGIGALFA